MVTLRDLVGRWRARRRDRLRARAIKAIARDVGERGFAVDFSALDPKAQEIAIAAAHAAILEAGAARGLSPARAMAFFGRNGRAIAAACPCRRDWRHEPGKPSAPR